MYFKGVITPQTLTLGETMSNEQIKIGLVVSSNGTTQAEIKDAEKLASVYERASKAAASIGGTSGSRAMAAKAAPVGSQALIDDKQYNQLRGAAGVTGASARDFANQAQGLGGLVRLYATFAANIFAATAAFSALKNAADTTNLVRGLDTLGASAGKSLGTLSKRLVEVTDGAISMREAMTAVAQTSSAGMSSQNIERLSLVAKNASLALGVSMPDALNRLSRGITKLEPELLDELGLFTKIGPATEEYARQIGKTAGSLTDFERRQAFANAVLEEGEKKFGALAQAASNPYDKLLASLKDVLQSGLELVNKVLTPIVSLLAESPAALSTVLAGIGFVLLKQALPAIGQFRAGLRASAQDALAAAESFKSSFGDQFQDIIEKRFKIPDIESQIKKTEQALAKASFGGTKPKSLQALEAGDLNQKNINNLLETRQKIIDEGIIRGKKASAQQIATAKQEADYIKLQVKLYEQRNQLATARAGTEEVANKPVGRFDPEVINLRKYQQLRTAVDKSEAIANAAQVAQVAGIRNSWALLNKEVGEKGLTGFAKFSTLAQGGLAAIGSRVMGVVGSLGAVGQAIGIAVAVFQGLDMVFSKNAKQMEKFNSSIESANESVDNVKRTLDAAKSAEGFSTRTIENTMAFSTALNELTDNMKSAIKASREAEEAAGWWDKFTNAVAGAFGASRDDKLGKAVAKQISSSIDLLSREGLDEEYAAQIKKILNVNSLADIDAVGAAWKRLSKDQKDALTAIQEQANRSLGNAASAIQSFKDKSAEATKTYKDFLNSFLDTSPTFKLGMSLIDVGNSLQTVIDAGPDRVAQAFDDIAKNSDKAALLGKNFVNGFTQIAKAFTQETLVINALNDAVKQYQKNLESLRAERENIQKYGINKGAAVQQENLARNREQMGIVTSDLITARKAAESIATPAINAARKLLEEGTKAIVEQGRALIQRSIKEAEFTGGQAITRALAGMLTGERKAQVEGQLAVDELKFRIGTLKANEQLISTQSELITQMQLNNALQEESNALYRLNNAEQKKDTNAIEKFAKELQAAQRGVGESKARAGLALTDEESNLLGESVINRIRTQQESARLTARQAVQAPRIQLERQLTAQQISNRQSEFRGREEDIKAEEQIQNRINAALLARQQVYFSLTDSADEQLIAARQTLELTDKQNRDKQETAELERRVAQIRVEANDADIAGRADLAFKYSEELNLLTGRLNKIKEAQAIENDTTGIKNRQELGKAQAEGYERQKQLFEAQAEADKLRLDSELQLKQLKLDTELGVEAALTKNLQLTESAKAIIEYQAGLRQAALDRDRVKIQANADFERQQAINLFEIRKILAKNQTVDGDITAQGQAELAQIYAREAAQKAGRDAAIQGADQLYNKNVAVAGAIKDAALRQDEWNQKLQLASDIAGSLRGAFEGATGAIGQFGQNIGTLVESLAQVANQNKNNADSMDMLNKKSAEAEKSGNWQAWFDLQDEKDKLTKKSQKDELNGYIQTTNAAKKMFKEKSTAYKALDAMEKVMHVAKLAREMKDLYVSLFVDKTKVASAVTAETAATSASVAGESARAPSTIAGIFGKANSQLGPIAGPIVAGGLIAVFLAMLASGGGRGGSKPSFTPTAAQAQEVQGTAMDYNSKGEKVQVRTGVLGDTSAKSQSIENSLKIIKENSVDGLSYDNKVVQLLESIDKGINKTALRAYNLPGVASGTAFGTLEGTRKGGGVLGTGLFASKVSTSIINSGLEISGSFMDLTKATEKDLIKVFEVVNVSKKNWYGKVTRWTETLTRSVKEIDMGLVEGIQDIFASARDTMVEVGKLVNVGASTIDEALSTLSLSNKFVSLRGLKGEELATQLNAVISSALDDATAGIFETFKQYQKFGEGLLETIVRITDSNAKVNQALKNIGAGQGRALDIAATEAFLDVVGGIDTFVEKYNKFSSNFLTEAERIKPKTLAVSQFITDLGFESVDTKEEFLGLVRSLDLSTDAGQKTFDSLMKVSEAFSEVTDYLDKLKETATGFSLQILKLTGRDAEALAMERQATLDKTEELFKPTQRYIFALEDVKTAQDNLTKARDREKSSLSSQKNALTGFLTNIKNFTDGLLLGSQSILTPLQKYTQAKDKFQELLTAASAIPSTEAEIKARDDAANQLTSAASAYLDASRAYNASSEAYTDDFNLVQEKLSGLSSVMTDQLATIDDQVNALTDNTTALQTVAEATQALATAMANEAIAKAAYTSSQSAVSAATSMPTTENKIKRAVSDIYQSAFGRAPDTGGLNYWTGVAAKDYYDAASQQVNSAALAQQIWGSSSPDDKVRAAYWKVLGRKESEIDAGGFQYWTNRIASGSISMQDFYAAVAGGATGSDVAKAEAWKRNPVYYARGGYASSGWAMVGEQGPELVDFQSPGRVYTAQQTQSAFAGATANMAELVQEVKRLNQEVQRLQQVVADGSMMNVQATERNTQEITQSVKSAETSQIHVQQISRKVAVV